MARIEKTVFISYRRKDISWALTVYQDLTHRGYDVFFDYTDISSGDFEQIILSNIKARAHFVLILTPTALDRCSEPDDWLRREIEFAIDEKRNIIPLFFDGFNFGNVSGKLTGKLQKLSSYNGMNVHQDYFLEAMERLRNKFLNIPLDAVLHPVSAEVQEVVLEEQRAANRAAEEAEAKREAFEARKKKQKEFIDRISKLVSSNIRRFSIGGIILIGILGILFAGNYIFNNLPLSETPEFTPSATLKPEIPTVMATFSPVTSIVTKIPFTPTVIFTPSITPNANPTKVSEQDGMVMMYVSEGEFTIGVENLVLPSDPARRYNQIPAEKVYVNAFWIDQTEVTNAMYGKCVDTGQCDKPLNEYENNIDYYFRDPEFEKFPVLYVDWYMASKYCSSVGRRLPSEAEWEKAARGTDGRHYPWGNDVNSGLARYASGRLEDVAEVGSYPLGASPYGVLDMEGNVQEWVGDIYQVYTKQREHKIARVGVESRVGWSSSDRFSWLGFRCAMDAD